jgi:hypothetical protein
MDIRPEFWWGVALPNPNATLWLVKIVAAEPGRLEQLQTQYVIDSSGAVLLAIVAANKSFGPFQIIFQTYKIE